MTRTKSFYLALLAVLLSPMAANAVPITISGFGAADGDWDVTLFGPTFFDFNVAELEGQIWWDDSRLAFEFAFAVSTALGAPNYSEFGPLFAYARDERNTIFATWTNASGNTSFTNIDRRDIVFYAIAERVNVPEPGTLALLGLGLAGMAARRRKKV